MIRPDDGMIFSLNDDMLTYSNDKSKNQFPNNLHTKYPFDILEKYQFIRCQKDDQQTLDHYAKVKNSYYSKRHRSDGHGGIK